MPPPGRKSDPAAEGEQLQNQRAALLGDSLHPGSTPLTDRLGDLLRLVPDSIVLDVAAGAGESAIHLATTRGCRVLGVDLSPTSVARATQRAAVAGVSHLCSFVAGDAERLPVGAESVDAVICECAFCTFTDKRAAAACIQRVLRPGGRVALSDLTRSGPVHPDVGGVLAWVACVADALPAEGYAEHLRRAGLCLELIEAHDDALRETVEDIRRRLAGARLLAGLGRLDLGGVDVSGGSAMARTALAEVRAGHLGYAVVVAVKPPRAGPA